MSTCFQVLLTKLLPVGCFKFAVKIDLCKLIDKVATNGFNVSTETLIRITNFAVFSLSLLLQGTLTSQGSLVFLSQLVVIGSSHLGVGQPNGFWHE